MIERVWRDGGTFQEWSETFVLDRWLDAMHAEGLDPDWYVTRHRTRDEVLPWAHIARRAPRAISCGTTGRTALAEHGLPDCRWTPCYDCGVCTDYALEHVVASPVPPAGGSPGHRPGPDQRRRGPGGVPRPDPSGREREVRGAAGVAVMRGDERGSRCGCDTRSTARSAGSAHRDVARAMERAFRVAELPLAFSEGFSPQPEGELRARAVDRARERRRSTSTSCSSTTVDLDALPASLTGALPDGLAVVGAAAPRRPGAGVARGRHGREMAVEVGGPNGETVDLPKCGKPLTVRWRFPTLTTTAAAQGSGGHRGRAAGDPPHARAATTHPTTVEMELHTQPRGAKPDEVMAAIGELTAVSTRGARTNGSSATARGRSRSTPTRARTRRRRVRHERRNRCQI